MSVNEIKVFTAIIICILHQLSAVASILPILITAVSVLIFCCRAPITREAIVFSHDIFCSVFFSLSPAIFFGYFLFYRKMLVRQVSAINKLKRLKFFTWPPPWKISSCFRRNISKYCCSFPYISIVLESTNDVYGRCGLSIRIYIFTC